MPVLAMIGWNALVLLAAVNVTPSAIPPPPEQMMAIPPELHRQLQVQVIDKVNAPEQRMQRLVDLVFQPQRLDPKKSIPPLAPRAVIWALRMAVAMPTW